MSWLSLERADIDFAVLDTQVAGAALVVHRRQSYCQLVLIECRIPGVDSRASGNQRMS
jgi:hypothetical protein